MPRALRNFCLLAWFVLLSSSASSQTTYKCGNTYSQTPCVGGVAIDTSDKRSDAQKNQADQVTRDNDKLVKELAAEREMRERSENRANATPGVMAPDKVGVVKRTPFKPTLAKEKKPKAEKGNKTAPKKKPTKPKA